MALDNVSYPAVQDMLAAQQAQIDKLASQFGASQAAQGGFGDLTPIAPWPTATTPGKNARITVTLRVAIPSTTNRLKIVLEQYTGSGSPVTVVDRIPSSDIEVTDDQRLAGQGDFVFPITLVPLAKYGCIKLVSIDQNGNRVLNPDVDFPDTPRNESDYLITFVTPNSVNAPSMPTLARIIENSIDPQGDGTLGFVTERIYANEAQTATFAEQLTESVQAKNLKVSDGTIERGALNIDDAAATFIDITFGDLEVGAEYEWVKNIAFSGGQLIDTPSSTPVTFFVGGFRDPDDGGLVSLAFVNVNPITISDGTQLRLKWRLNQPGPAWPGPGCYRLLSYVLESRLTSGVDADYIDIFEGDIRAPRYNTPGDIVIRHTIGVNPEEEYFFRLTVTAVGGFTRSYTSGAISTGSSPPPVPPTVLAPSKPTLGRIITNTINPTGNGLQAVTTLRVFGNEAEAANFANQGIAAIQAKLVKTIGGSFVRPNVLIDTPSDTFIDLFIGDLLAAGFKYEWIKNTGLNGPVATSAPSTSTIEFFAGGFKDPSDSLASLSTVSIAGTPFDDGTQIGLVWKLGQPTPPYPLLSYFVERKKDGEADSTYILVVDVTDIQQPVYNTAGTITISNVSPARPTKTYIFRMTVTSIGGFTKQFTSAAIAAGS